MKMGRLLVAICLITGFPVISLFSAHATENPAGLCERAADMATTRSNIPGNILRAIALTETGRNIDGALRPWPWVLNVGGNAVWFQSQAETLAHADQLIAAGTTNFDIGCFQLNYRWHAANFDSLRSMLDPEINASYAAQFLAQKHADLGSWGDAVGAYHSGTVALANVYLARFKEIYSSIDTVEDQTTLAPVVQVTTPEEPTNHFPLLLPGKYGNGGSLVPTQGDARPMFGDLE